MEPQRYSNSQFKVEVGDQVATIWPAKFLDADGHARAEEGGIPAALTLARLLSEMRFDDEIRVIVLHRGGKNHTGNPSSHYRGAAWQKKVNQPQNKWRTWGGIVRLMEIMCLTEKVIVTQLDGDVIGGGCYLALAADFIVARKGSRFMDHHLGMGEAEPFGPPFGFVPGDGGLSLAPLFFSPPIAKEFLMLAKEFTAEELAAQGVINYAVDADKIDGVVADLVARLLKRPAYALAWAKRVANKHVIQQLNLTLDAGVGYQMTGMAQLEMQGWEDRLTL